MNIFEDSINGSTRIHVTDAGRDRVSFELETETSCLSGNFSVTAIRRFAENILDNVPTTEPEDFSIRLEDGVIRYRDPVFGREVTTYTPTVVAWENNKEYWEETREMAQRNIAISKAVVGFLKKHEKDCEDLIAKDKIMEDHGFSFGYKDADDNLRSIVDALYEKEGK